MFDRKPEWERSVPRNSGLAFEMREGQVVAVSAAGVVDFVAFNLENLRERFDQARTKSNQSKIYLSTGDILYSKLNNEMMQIVEDRFQAGRHDLQYGGCSRRRFQVADERGDLESLYGRPMRLEDLPDHGCWENLSTAVEPYGIRPEDVPSPFNIFQDMKIDSESGRMVHSPVRPKRGEHVLLQAKMDLLIAVSACPDLVEGGREGARIALFAKGHSSIEGPKTEA